MSVSEIQTMSEIDERQEPNHEILNHDGIGNVRIGCGPSDSQLMEQMLYFRAKFIKRMRWSTDNSHSTYEPIKELDWLNDSGNEQLLKEADVYDSFERTMHFIMTDHDTGELIAGLRLTPVTSVEDSLSWSMFEKRPLMKQRVYESKEADGVGTIARLNASASRHNLYDLTRLVTPDLNDYVDPLRIPPAMVEMFAVSYGAIKRATPEEEWEDVRWIFTGTSSLVGALNHLGIEHRVLSSGKINKIDDSKSYFCTVKPEESMRKILELSASADPSVATKYKMPLAQMEIGFRKANAL